MMVGKRRVSNTGNTGLVSSSAQMKFRPVTETSRGASKGTKLLPQPVTVSEVMTKVVVHFCKRILHTDPALRVTAYAVILFFVSLVTDYLPLPRSYFSESSNVFNQLFVKFSWGWTFSLVFIFQTLTSSVYCCGNKKLISRHFGRLVVATLVWYVWTTVFITIEETTGKCLYAPNVNNSAAELVFSKGRRSCYKSGGKWTSFDISGHSFLLVWCVFFIIEESRPITGWDTITDHIRDENHKRSSSSLIAADLPETPLSSLSPEEFLTVKRYYTRHSAWAKGLVILLTLLVLIWDLMLVMTACYFHIMIEKVLGGLIALSMWRLTYGWFYRVKTPFSPGLPGNGRFKYYTSKSTSVPCKSLAQGGSKKGAVVQDPLPSFMGMPLYALRNQNKGFGSS